MPLKVRTSGSFSIVERGVTVERSVAFVSTSGSGRRHGDRFGRRRRKDRTDLGVLRDADDDLLLEGARGPAARPSAGTCRGSRFKNWKTPSERVVTVRPSGICGPVIETRTPGSGAAVAVLRDARRPSLSSGRGQEGRAAAVTEDRRSRKRIVMCTPSKESVNLPRSLSARFYTCSSRVKSSKVSRRRIEDRPAVFDEHLGGARPEVVVGGHREAVGAGVADREQVAFLAVERSRRRAGSSRLVSQTGPTTSAVKFCPPEGPTNSIGWIAS